jgi:hypothetical protein
MGKDHRKGKRFPVKPIVKGYRRVVSLDGHRINLHRERAEKALGRPLPPSAIVHHADGSTSDDAPLVICQDQKYHKLLHRRMAIVAAGGNPNTDKVCSRCRVPKNRALFSANRAQADGLTQYCKDCHSQYIAERVA